MDVKKPELIDRFFSIDLLSYSSDAGTFFGEEVIERGDEGH